MENAKTSPAVTREKRRFPCRMSTTCVAAPQNATLVRAKSTWNHAASAIAGRLASVPASEARSTTVITNVKIRFARICRLNDRWRPKYRYPALAPIVASPASMYTYERSAAA